MIHISISAHVQGYYGRLLSARSLTQGSPAQHVGLENSALLTGSLSTVPPVVVDRQLGWLKEDDKSYGAMRDKGASHLNASGDVEILGDSFFDSVNAYGFPQAKRQNGQYVQYDKILAWGDPYDISRTASYSRYWDNNKGWWVLLANSTIHNYTSWHGTTKLCFVTESINGEARKENGSLLQATTYTGTIHKYRVDPTTRRIYAHGNVSRTSASSSSWYTSTEVQAAADSIPSTGGTLWDLFGDLICHSYGTTSEIADIVCSEIESRMSTSVLGIDQHPVDFGELSLECSAQTKFVDQNVLGLLFDVEDPRNFHALWKSVLNLDGWKKAFSVLKGSSNRGTKQQLGDLFNPASSSYLFTKYAVLPTVSDCRRLLEGAARSSLFLKHQRLHSRKVTSISTPTQPTVNYTAVMTVQCAEYPNHVTGLVNRLVDTWKHPDHASDWAQEAIATGKKWGVYPELPNLWDYLPYSFVADWFVQFGDLFKDVNSYLDTEYYFPIHHCVMSEKWSYDVEMVEVLPQYAATGLVQISYYVRWISLELPLPSVSLTAESQAGLHSLEASALVLQRLR